MTAKYFPKAQIEVKSSTSSFLAKTSPENRVEQPTKSMGPF